MLTENKKKPCETCRFASECTNLIGYGSFVCMSNVETYICNRCGYTKIKDHQCAFCGQGK